METEAGQHRECEPGSRSLSMHFHSLPAVAQATAQMPPPPPPPPPRPKLQAHSTPTLYRPATWRQSAFWQTNGMSSGRFAMVLRESCVGSLHSVRACNGGGGGEGG